MTRTVLWCKIFNYFLHISSADTLKINRRCNHLFQKRKKLLWCHYIQWYLKFLHQHWQKLLKVLDISVLSSKFSPFKVKNAGKYFLSLHLFKISLIVEQVCRIFDLFFIKLVGIILYFCLPDKFFKVLSYDFKFALILSWRSVPVLMAFSLRNILSRYLIEFNMPLVIRWHNLCLCFLNLTVLGARCLDFAFRRISSKRWWFIFGSQNKSGSISKVSKYDLISWWNAWKELSSERLILTNFGACLVNFKISNIDRYGKWSDMHFLSHKKTGVV